MEDEDISKLDPDLIMARQLEELEKERKELQVFHRLTFLRTFIDRSSLDKVEEPGKKSGSLGTC